jgi:hypothetical protein
MLSGYAWVRRMLRMLEWVEAMSKPPEKIGEIRKQFHVWRNPNGTWSAVSSVKGERLYIGKNAKLLDGIFGFEDKNP